MKESNHIEKSIQLKFHSFLHGVASCFSKPENRFLREMFFGILCSTHVHASKMEGLYGVHDGSAGDLRNGYWTIGVIGCEPNPEKRNRLEIHPLYTELYSYHTKKINILVRIARY
jgi:hypothetical protein